MISMDYLGLVGLIIGFIFIGVGFFVAARPAH